MRQRVTKHIYYLHKYTMERYTKSKGVYLKKKLAHKDIWRTNIFHCAFYFFMSQVCPIKTMTFKNAGTTCLSHPVSLEWFPGWSDVPRAETHLENHILCRLTGISEAKLTKFTQLHHSPTEWPWASELISWCESVYLRDPKCHLLPSLWSTSVNRTKISVSAKLPGHTCSMKGI